MKKISSKKWSERSSIKLTKIPKGEVIIQAFGHPIGQKNKTTVFRWTFVMVTPRGTIIKRVTGVKSDPRLRGILCAPVLAAVMRGIEAAKREGYTKITVVSRTAYPETALEVLTPKMSIMLSWVVRSYRRWITANTSDIDMTYAVRTR